MEFSLSWELILFLFFSAMLAGFIDAIAGGGGLLTLPALLIAQVPPLPALATNKLQASFGTLTASLTMLRHRVVRWSKVRSAFKASLVGSVIGTATVHWVDAEVLTLVIPIVLIVIALYFGLQKRLGEKEKPAIISEKKYRYGVVPSIGFYDGFFGPGTGSLLTLANVSLMGRTLIQATAHAKCLNFASNMASMVVFIASGKVLWLVGGVMIVGQILGAYIGGHTVLNHGQKIIRPLMVLMCVAMCVKLLME